MTNSKRKGKTGELELAAKLRELGFDCRRGQQYNGIDGQDVVGIPGVHIECKRVQREAVRKWMQQAVKDAGTAVPMVCHRPDRGEWLVTLRLKDLRQAALVLVNPGDL